MKQINRIPPPFIVLAAAALVSSCADPERTERADGGDASESGDMEPVEIDETAIMAQAMAYEDNLVPLSEEVEQSETHSDAASVFVWGSADAADKFHSIDPDDPTQSISFSPTTMFVKEHFDANGDKVGLTVMYKAPEGYNPEARDWFWARVRGEEITHSGQVSWCSECHDAAHNSDFVVGFGKSP